MKPKKPSLPSPRRGPTGKGNPSRLPPRRQFVAAAMRPPKKMPSPEPKKQLPQKQLKPPEKKQAQNRRSKISSKQNQKEIIQKEILSNPKNKEPETDKKTKNPQLTFISLPARQTDKITKLNPMSLDNFPPIREKPFVIDLGPSSLFDKSTVETPPPGFSLRSKYRDIMLNYQENNGIMNSNMNNIQQDSENRLDTASEMIFPDGHHVVINGEPKYQWPPPP